MPSTDYPDFYKRLRRLRARAAVRGFKVIRSRKAVSPKNRGGLMILDTDHSAVIAGGAFDLSLEDAEQRVDELVSAIEARSLRFGGNR